MGQGEKFFPKIDLKPDSLGFGDLDFRTIRKFKVQDPIQFLRHVHRRNAQGDSGSTRNPLRSRPAGAFRQRLLVPIGEMESAARPAYDCISRVARDIDSVRRGQRKIIAIASCRISAGIINPEVFCDEAVYWGAASTRNVAVIRSKVGNRAVISSGAVTHRISQMIFWSRTA
jgi:hypothetical protein